MERTIEKEIVISFIDKLENELFEIRDIKIGYSGYYDNSEIATNEIEKHFKEHGNSLYITLNPLNKDSVDSSYINKPIARHKETTKDKDISYRKNILIDLDPEREKGTSSTKEQKETALRVAKWVLKQIYKDENLCLKAYPKLISDSGNGVHLYYDVAGETDTESVHSLLKYFKQRIEELTGKERAKGKEIPYIKVDTCVANLARVVRIAGIPNTKTSTYIETKILEKGKSIPVEGGALNAFRDKFILRETKEKKTKEVKAKPKDIKGSTLKTPKAAMVNEVDKTSYAELKKIESALNALDSSLEHDEWIRCIYALREAGERIGERKALELAQEWSSKSSMYDEKAVYEIEKVFQDGARDITIGTLFHYAEKTGWKYEKYGYLFEGVDIEEKLEAPNIPLECFPSAIQELAKNVSGSTGIEEKAILGGSISVLSAVLCDKAKVKIGQWEESLVWSTCLVAETGTRKTMLINTLLAPVVDNIEMNMDTYKKELRAWERDKLRKEKEIAKLAKEEGTEERIQDIEDKLEETRPIFPNYLLNSATPEAMIELLEKTKDKEGKSKVLIYTDEGEEVLNGFTGHYNNGKTNNKIYLAGHDGKGHIENRKTSGYRHLKKIYIPMLFAVQPSIIEKALSSHGEGLKGQGMLARLNFIPFTRSATGYASLKEFSKHSGSYEALIRELMSIGTGIYDNDKDISLKLSDEAEKVFAKIYDKLEKEEFIKDEIQDYRCKQGGKILRLAGLLHYAFGYKHEYIEVDSIKRAYKLYVFFRDTALAFTRNKGTSLDRYIEDLKELLAQGKEYVVQKDFRKYRAESGEKILLRLQDAGYIKQIGAGKRYAINPMLKEMT